MPQEPAPALSVRSPSVVRERAPSWIAVGGCISATRPPDRSPGVGRHQRWTGSAAPSAPQLRLSLFQSFAARLYTTPVDLKHAAPFGATDERHDLERSCPSVAARFQGCFLRATRAQRPSRHPEAAHGVTGKLIRSADESLPQISATSVVIAGMDHACAVLPEPVTDLDDLSVGAGIDVSHLAPTPFGTTIPSQAGFDHIEAPLYWFDVWDDDGRRTIGEGRIA